MHRKAAWNASVSVCVRILQPLQPNATLTLHYGSSALRRRSNLLTGFNGNCFVVHQRLAGLIQADFLIAAA